jgi:hypothetical protein
MLASSCDGFQLVSIDSDRVASTVVNRRTIAHQLCGVTLTIKTCIVMHTRAIECKCFMYYYDTHTHARAHTHTHLNQSANCIFTAAEPIPRCAYVCIQIGIGSALRISVPHLYYQVTMKPLHYARKNSNPIKVPLYRYPHPPRLGGGGYLDKGMSAGTFWDCML